MTRYYSGLKKKDIECCLQEALHYLLRMSGYRGASRPGRDPSAQLSPARSAVTLSAPVWCRSELALGALAGWGLAKQEAPISLSSQGMLSSASEFPGDLCPWLLVPPHPGTVSLSESFHAAERGYAGWSGSQELHVSDKLDIALPRTICHCLEWSTPPGKI